MKKEESQSEEQLSWSQTENNDQGILSAGPQSGYVDSII